MSDFHAAIPFSRWVRKGENTFLLDKEQKGHLKMFWTSECEACADIAENEKCVSDLLTHLGRRRRCSCTRRSWTGTRAPSCRRQRRLAARPCAWWPRCHSPPSSRSWSRSRSLRRATVRQDSRRSRCCACNLYTHTKPSMQCGGVNKYCKKCERKGFFVSGAPLTRSGFYTHAHINRAAFATSSKSYQLFCTRTLVKLRKGSAPTALLNFLPKLLSVDEICDSLKQMDVRKF